MLRNLIFDFGGVLINLDMQAVPRGLKKFGVEIPDPGLIELSIQYETGHISSQDFLAGVRQYLPGSREDEVQRIWNETIADLPPHRLDYLEALKRSGCYRMFLLSNTNALHMEQVRTSMGARAFRRFQDCFHGFYLSHELGMRKPEPGIFEFVLSENGLKAEETLFIDDTEEHVLSARSMGIHTWHLQVGQEDILELQKRLV